MNATPSFVCPHCGKRQEGWPTDRGYTLPDEVWAIPEPERSERAKWSADLCVLGERFFIRCILDVPFTDQPGCFGWGLWAEVASPAFARYVELFDKDGSSEPACPATIANDLPGYDTTLGQPVIMQFQTATQRPALRFPAGATCRLALEQAQGIDSLRYHQLLESFGYKA
jgi:hypothetical protein